MSTLRLVIIGQAPRADVTPDIAAAFSPEMDIVGVGAFDRFDSAAEVEVVVSPRGGQPVYVSRPADGTPVTVDRESVVELLGACFRDFESEVTAIGVLCAGHFPSFDVSVPIFEPSDLLSAQVSATLNGGTLGVTMPREEQEVMTFEKWVDYDFIIVMGSPYADDDEVLIAVADTGTDADLIVMDHMGYTPEMKVTVRELTGTGVLFGRSVLVKTAEEAFRMADYREVTTRLFAENMNTAPDETLLVVTNIDTNHISRALFEAGVDLGLNSGLFEIPPMERNGMEPPGSVAHVVESADVVVCPTGVSLTRTRAQETAIEAGAHVAMMSGITDQMFSAGVITADYEEVERLTAMLTEKLTAADEARTGAGGVLAMMSPSGRDGVPSDSIIADPGDSGNLPPDESYAVPVKGTTTGTLVLDGGLVGVDVLDDPLTAGLDAGYITSVESAIADEFLDVTSGGDCARWVCELGLGTNPATSIIGTVLEDEKVYGTCHVALGDSLGFGGTTDCDSYLDGVILESTVSFDGDVVVIDGEVRA